MWRTLRATAGAARRRLRHPNPYPSRRRALPLLQAGLAQCVGQLAALCPGRTEWSYTATALSHRADQRLAKLARFGLLAGCRRALEIGAGSGDLVYGLRQAGIQAVGIEVNAVAIEGGRQAFGHAPPGIVQGNATAIPLASDSIDLACSWDVYEHLADPQAVTDEVHRCLKPGGAYFIHCGSLYFSPWGGHLYRQIRIPWAHLLFSQNAQMEFLDSAGFGNHPNNPYSGVPGCVWMNQWPLARFRELLHQNKWQVVDWFEAPVPPYERAFGQSLRDCLAPWSDEDLFTATFDVVLRKC